MRRCTALVCLLLLLGGFGASAQNWELKGTLVTGASQDETTLWVEKIADIQADARILIESRDGTRRQTLRVIDVIETHVLLDARLTDPYPSGSRIFQ